MIDYILIIFAVICFAAQFAFTKVYEDSVGQRAITTLVMLAGTSIVGALLFFFIGGCRVQISDISLLWGAVFAVTMIPYYMVGIKVLSLGSLAVYGMFMMLGGMLVPFFYGIIFLSEDISIGKIMGTVLLTGCIILQAFCQSIQGDSKKSEKNGKYLFFLLCLVIFFVNGMTGVIAKAHSVSEGAVDEASFTVIYCAMTAVLSLAVLAGACMKNSKSTLAGIKLTLKLKPMLVTAILGGAVYGGNFFLLLAADTVPASVQFPLVSGGVIVLSSLISAFVFKEKISKNEWISVAGAFASTFLFAF